MARGADEKQLVQEKLVELFPNAFVYDKILRIPIGDVQIKVTLTAAKDNVECGGDVALPGEDTSGIETVAETQAAAAEPSQEEIDAVSHIMSNLGF